MAKSKRRPIEDPEETALKAAAVEEARASVAAGRFVRHEVVREWLKDLAAGRYRPPPIPKKWK
jgi:predicted transcriptional regulator